MFQYDGHLVSLFMHSDADLVRIWWVFDSTKVMQIWHGLASRCVVLWKWIIDITVSHPMACNGALYLAPNTQTCLFLRSGIVIFAPAGAVFIAIIKPWCLTSLWRVHWLTNSHTRMGLYQVVDALWCGVVVLLALCWCPCAEIWWLFVLCRYVGKHAHGFMDRKFHAREKSSRVSKVKSPVHPWVCRVWYRVRRVAN